MQAKLWTWVLLAVVCILVMPLPSAHSATKGELEQYARACRSILEETLYDLPVGSTVDHPLSTDERLVKGGKMARDTGASLEYSISFYEKVFAVVAKRMRMEISIRDQELASWNDRFIRGIEDSYEITRDTRELMKREGSVNKDTLKKVERHVSKRIDNNSMYYRELQKDFETVIQPLSGDGEARLNMYNGVPVYYLYVEGTWKFAPRASRWSWPVKTFVNIGHEPPEKSEHFLGVGVKGTIPQVVSVPLSVTIAKRGNNSFWMIGLEPGLKAQKAHFGVFTSMGGAGPVAYGYRLSAMGTTSETSYFKAGSTYVGAEVGAWVMGLSVDTGIYFRAGGDKSSDKVLFTVGLGLGMF